MCGIIYVCCVILYVLSDCTIWHVYVWGILYGTLVIYVYMWHAYDAYVRYVHACACVCDMYVCDVIYVCDLWYMYVVLYMICGSTWDIYVRYVDACVYVVCCYMCMWYVCVWWACVVCMLWAVWAVHEHTCMYSFTPAAQCFPASGDRVREELCVTNEVLTCQRESGHCSRLYERRKAWTGVNLISFALEGKKD